MNKSIKRTGHRWAALLTIEAPGSPDPASGLCYIVSNVHRRHDERRDFVFGSLAAPGQYLEVVIKRK